MAADKIRLGVIGANATRGWAPRSHLPAIAASPEFELTAVCTTRLESAEESARQYGARLAFHDYRDMLSHPEIDAVAVVVRVPSHYQPTRDALEAGKHVYTEWPLSANLAEAQELAILARARKVQTMVGLQARVSPAISYTRELVEEGYVGQVVSCYATQIREGVLERTSDRTWDRVDTAGANTLTVAGGHTIDTLRFVVGDFSHVAAVVDTQVRQWLETDTQRLVDVTAPDNVLVSGRLANGGVASVHVASVPWKGSGYRMEIYGRRGALVASCDTSPQVMEVRLQGAKAGDARLQDLEVPPRHAYGQEETPNGPANNVGRMYYRFAQSIRSGEAGQPNFDTALELHRLLDTIRAASNQGRETPVPTG